MAYQLIWFQHFHKAAGSSLVESAQLNGEVFWPSHINGNPTDKAGKQLSLWSYDSDQLNAFIDECEKTGVSFVASEWGLPEIEVLAADPRVSLLTITRDPLSRLVSNFYYDLYNGYTDVNQIEDYVGARQRTFTMDNYYCRILARVDNRLQAVQEEDFLLAKQNLSHFDKVFSLEQGLGELSNRFDWKLGLVHVNSGGFDLRAQFGRLLRGQFSLALKQLRFPKQAVSGEFEVKFKDENRWDYHLLEGPSSQAE